MKIRRAKCSIRCFETTARKGEVSESAAELVGKGRGKHGLKDRVRSQHPWALFPALCDMEPSLCYCQTLGIQSIILTSSAFLILPLISVSISFLLKKRPRKPLTGSVWFAHSTHLWHNSRNGHQFSSVLLSVTILDYISLLISRLSGSKWVIPVMHVFQQKLLWNISLDEPIFIVHCFSSFVINLLCLNSLTENLVEGQIS